VPSLAAWNIEYASTWLEAKRAAYERYLSLSLFVGIARKLNLLPGSEKECLPPLGVDFVCHGFFKQLYFARS